MDDRDILHEFMIHLRSGFFYLLKRHAEIFIGFKEKWNLGISSLEHVKVTCGSRKTAGVVRAGTELQKPTMRNEGPEKLPVTDSASKPAPTDTIKIDLPWPLLHITGSCSNLGCLAVIAP